MNVVVVEDHDAFREVLMSLLESAGYSVAGLSCAEELAEAKLELPTHVYVVDLGLPGEDGLSLISRLRERSPGAGILALSARSKTEARIAGYRSGADLYLCKPVEFQELLATVEAVGRKVASTRRDLGTAIHICVRSQSALGHGHRVMLTEREMALVGAFVRARRGQLERWQVAEILGIDLELASRAALEVAIARLRSKLRQVSGSDDPI